MEFKYTFHQIPHSDFVVQAVEDKVGHSMRYLFGHGTVQVSFSKKGHAFTIGIAIKGNGGIYYKASATCENLYAAIDLVKDKLEKQFRKQRKKLQNHKRYALSKEGRMDLLDEGLSTDFSYYWKGQRKAA
jgi:putative sigma-54 modulation protein